MNKSLFLILFLFSLNLRAEVWSHVLNPSQKLFIKGYWGNVIFHKSLKPEVKIQVLPDTKEGESPLKANWSEESGELRFSMSPFESKQEWLDQRATKRTQKTVHIYSPSTPLELHWKKGHVTLSQWEHKIFLNLLEGEISVSNSKTPMVLNIQEGQLRVNKIEGQVDVNSYKAYVNFSNSKGKLSIRNFLGVTRLKSHEGDIFLDSQQGISEIAESQGELEFENGRRPLRITSFEGKVRGKTAQGKIHAKLLGEINFRIRSEEGDVEILTKNSGAMVNLGTKEGQFHVAPYLKHTRYPTIKIVRGRLRGEKKGYVHVRTATGKIRLR